VRSFGPFGFVCVAVALGACNTHEKEGNELSLLIQKVQGYTDADEADQPGQLAALRAFAPTTERVQKARETCLQAYTLVERAEREHAEAKRMLDRVTSGAGDLVKTRPAIERRIASARESIDGATPRIAKCTRLLSDLKRDHR
jgi:hypothetical protein